MEIVNINILRAYYSQYKFFGRSKDQRFRHIIRFTITFYASIILKSFCVYHVLCQSRLQTENFTVFPRLATHLGQWNEVAGPFLPQATHAAVDMSLRILAHFNHTKFSKTWNFLEKKQYNK